MEELAGFSACLVQTSALRQYGRKQERLECVCPKFSQIRSALRALRQVALRSLHRLSPRSPDVTCLSRTMWRHRRKEFVGPATIPVC